ncbi:MAG: ribonuclease T [Pseudomonadota bacterium]|nr:ribonuclease T [Gammaproteobacteria bacterium]MBU1558491.1 ribonuclease T [Gammaproteobacteria bacterium]MBU1628936.1 ribonuclease T [Gammaproteobacteria bacterium]MBU1926327.1 ribonuclease T [Gammaproteobacteria bacterium]MBU2545854.1 ribonuclease T [Gammaproteobacteria bacterium]
MSTDSLSPIAKRFRRYLPVVIDIETAGLNASTDAVLEVAAVLLKIDADGWLHPDASHFCHVTPFENANIDPEALEFNGIDPDHPFRFAVSENEALQTILLPIRKAVRTSGCLRAVLVGHNPAFDLGFLTAMIDRCQYKHSPFHPFTTLDTATLSALALGHTVLAVACERAGISFETNKAHSALYDAQKTAELFCFICNEWKRLGGQTEFNQ